ncbi:MAG: hypothetical protein ABIB93_02645, partial [Chloroflexota bacterium]
MTKIFEEDWLKSLEKKYALTSERIKPFIANLALDPVLSEERNRLENWFQGIPEKAKPDIFCKLRSKDSHQHFGAYYEIVMYYFLRSLGYDVDMHPAVSGKEPDFIITGDGLDKPVVVEVATVFDDPEWQKKERRLIQVV